MDKRQNFKKQGEKTCYYFVTDAGEYIPVSEFAGTLHYLALYIIREFTSSYLHDIESDAKYGRKGKLVMINDILSRQKSGEYDINNCSLVIAKFVMSYFTIVKTADHLTLSNREIRMIEFVIKKDLDMTLEDAEVKILENGSAA